MVKRRSCLASNKGSQVRFLVEALNVTAVYGVCSVAVSARLTVNQQAPVRLRSDTPNELSLDDYGIACPVISRVSGDRN